MTESTEKPILLQVDPSWETNYPRVYKKIKHLVTPLNEIYQLHLNNILRQRSDEEYLRFMIAYDYPAKEILDLVRTQIVRNNSAKSELYTIDIKPSIYQKLAQEWITLLQEKIKKGVSSENTKHLGKSFVWLLQMSPNTDATIDFVKSIANIYNSANAKDKTYLDRLFDDVDPEESLYSYDIPVEEIHSVLPPKLVQHWQTKIIDKFINTNDIKRHDVQQVWTLIGKMDNSEKGVQTIITNYIDSVFSWKKKSPRSLENHQYESFEKLYDFIRDSYKYDAYREAAMFAAQAWKNDARFMDLIKLLHEDENGLPQKAWIFNFYLWLDEQKIVSVKELIKHVEPVFDTELINWIVPRMEDDPVLKNHIIQVWSNVSKLDKKSLHDIAQNWWKLDTFPPIYVDEEIRAAIHQKVMQLKEPFKYPAVLYASAQEMPVDEKIRFFISFWNNTPSTSREKVFMYARDHAGSKTYMSELIQHINVTNSPTHNNFYRSSKWDILDNAIGTFVQWFPEKKHELIALDAAGVSKEDVKKWFSNTLFNKDIDMEPFWNNMLTYMQNDMPINFMELMIDYVQKELGLQPKMLDLDSSMF